MEGLKEKGAKVIIGEFYASSARIVMCTAYRLGMTQREGYVWFLPGWFEENWYDVDNLKILKATMIQEGAEKPVDKNKGVEIDIENTNRIIGPLPDCTTSEMLEALSGHLSLIHKHIASNNQTPDVGNYKTVRKWKEYMAEGFRNMSVTKRNNEKKSLDTEVDQDMKINESSDFNLTHSYAINDRTVKDATLNKYSGYVYDAVWLYAKSLDTLIRQSNQSYIQNLHSKRTVEQFVSIIKKMDFFGVSGRINFLGKKPLDNPKECGILSSFATNLDIECQLAITIAFIIGFVILLLILFVILLIFKRR